MCLDKTVSWFQGIELRDDRYDGVVEYEGVPVGLVGLLNIDKKNRKAESYIVIGRHEYKNKGIGYKAEKLILDYAFNTLKLNKVFAFIETGNKASLLLHQKVGYIIEGCFRQDIYMPEKGWVDRYVVSIFRGGSA